MATLWRAAPTVFPDAGRPPAAALVLSVRPSSVGLMPAAAYRSQPSLDDLGTPLPQVSFTVVDLETTGGGDDAAITEIGAVRVCGGEVTGEFQTLVNPAAHIPALIAVLTGITDQMVADAPRLSAVLPGFLEFARGSVLVAHNAGFDVGFLKRACAEHSTPWPGFPVIDTVALARQVLLRDEVPNCKLATLAQHFSATTSPNHRALSDARATVDVLHGLIGRVGNLGVHTLEDLDEFTRRVSPQRRAKRVWADRLPSEPGVYCFYSDHTGSGRREVLYVGKSVNIRTRVRGYFTASEKRARMEEMVRVSSGVEATVCATPLEAEVRELRLIQAHQPRYNRRSRRQQSLLWIKLTDEAFPRLSIVRTPPRDAAAVLGPFTSRAVADEAALALFDAFALRQCTRRLSRRTPSSACALGEMGRCLAPCELGPAAESYSRVVDEVRLALGVDVRPVLDRVAGRMQRLVGQERFEEAASLRRRLDTYSSTVLRLERVRSLARCPQIVAAAPGPAGGSWQIHVIRNGRLAAAGTSRPGEVPQAVARDLVRGAETVVAPASGLPACSIEEAERVAAWLESPGVRIMDIDGEWSWPVHIALSDSTYAAHTLGSAGQVPVTHENVVTTMQMAARAV